MNDSSSKSLIVKRLTIYLDPEVDRRLREKADEEERSLSQIAERAFRRELKMLKTKKPLS